MKFGIEYNKRTGLINARSEREFMLRIGAFCLLIYWTRGVKP